MLDVLGFICVSVGLAFDIFGCIGLIRPAGCLPSASSRHQMHHPGNLQHPLRNLPDQWGQRPEGSRLSCASLSLP